MILQIIDTGYFYADGGAMFGAIPKSAWSLAIRATRQTLA